MTRSNLFGSIVVDPEIERTTLKNLRARIRHQVEELGLNLDEVQSENMAELQRTMSEYVKSSLIGVELSIVRLTVAANNFKIKPNIIQMV